MTSRTSTTTFTQPPGSTSAPQPATPATAILMAAATGDDRRRQTITPLAEDEGPSKNHLISLLTRQLALCSQLVQSCAQTRAFDEQSDRDIQIQTLIASIASRQPLIDELVDLNTLMEPYRANWDQWTRDMGIDESRRIQSGLSAVNAAILTIIDYTNRDRIELERRRDAVNQDMQLMTVRQHRSHAYGSMALRQDRSRTNKFINERG